MRNVLKFVITCAKWIPLFVLLYQKKGVSTIVLKCSAGYLFFNFSNDYGKDQFSGVVEISVLLNDIFFVGYQAKGIPGRKMIEKKIPVKAGIHALTAYSSHVDQKILVDWVQSMPQPPKEIRLVHGEFEARRTFALALGITTD